MPPARARAWTCLCTADPCAREDQLTPSSLYALTASRDRPSDWLKTTLPGLGLYPPLRHRTGATEVGWSPNYERTSPPAFPPSSSMTTCRFRPTERHMDSAPFHRAALTTASREGAVVDEQDVHAVTKEQVPTGSTSAPPTAVPATEGRRKGHVTARRANARPVAELMNAIEATTH